MEHKTEMVERWSADPCLGSFKVSAGPSGIEYPIGSPGFCDWSEYERYVIKLPWLRSTVRFGDHAGHKVLEIGFGLGIDLLSFARRGAQVYGLELTPRQIDLTRQRFSLWGYPCRLVRGDGETLPFSSGAFDLVYVFDVMGYTPDAVDLIREMDRVLKPGGTAIIGIHMFYFLPYFYRCWTWLVRVVFRLTDWMFSILKGALGQAGTTRDAFKIITFMLLAVLTWPFRLLAWLFVRTLSYWQVHRLFLRSRRLHTRIQCFGTTVVVWATK